MHQNISWTDVIHFEITVKGHKLNKQWLLPGFFPHEPQDTVATVTEREVLAPGYLQI